MNLEVLKRNRFKLNVGQIAFQVLNSRTSTSKSSILGPPPKAKPNQDLLLPIKRLTTSEMYARRKQVICYIRDDKFTLGHKCKPKQLYLLNGEGEDGNSNEELVEEAEGEGHDSRVEISVYALTGTVKLRK